MTTHPSLARPLSAILAAVVILGAITQLPASSGAQTPPASGPRHGLSVFGDLKYPADFKHFEYVNPNAPKGGKARFVGLSFDSLNPFILKGDKPYGLGAPVDLVYDSLMTPAADEPGSYYGLIAESADVAPDRKSVIFKMRPEARFADGTPVTSEDVVHTFDLLKTKGHPAYRLSLLKDVVKAEALGPHTVKYSFEGNRLRDLPITVASLAVTPKAFWAKQPFEETFLNVMPLGSGAYRVEKIDGNTSITYRRRDDYWAKDLPVNRGRYNFDEIQYIYIAERSLELQAILAGTYDIREEFTSRDWAAGYNVPAVKEGRLVRVTLPDETPSGTQGFFINTRRAKFADPRVRRALDYAFDFETTNRTLFFGLYERTVSYFENSDLKASGKPSPAELAVLEPFRASLPPEVFGEVYVPPKTDGSGNDTRNLREAVRLLNEAGFVLKGQKRVNAAGVELSIEFLITDATSERLLNPYVKNLNAIGITATMRRVDTAQYQRRVKEYDFDIANSRFVMSLNPGSELDNYFNSANAKTEGSRNLAGVSSPAVDALVARIGEAKTRDELVAASRALDRVLRAGHYWVSHWYKGTHHVAYWDKYDRPAIKPKYARAITDTWWFNAEKAAKLRQPCPPM
ncbi:MAG TPA: extracellular solute-binding protein [Hyphomicrobiaceae bacterium]|nr:extracellular solute-binding protein [Hyphomicrobiaceae bacterium]